MHYLFFYLSLSILGNQRFVLHTVVPTGREVQVESCGGVERITFTMKDILDGMSRGWAHFIIDHLSSYVFFNGVNYSISNIVQV